MGIVREREFRGEVNLYAEDARLVEDGKTVCLEIIARGFTDSPTYIVHVPVDSVTYKKLHKLIESYRPDAKVTDNAEGGAPEGGRGRSSG